MNIPRKNQVITRNKLGALHLMRNFCKDYSRKTSKADHKILDCNKYQRKKTDSADKMSKFLYNVQYSTINQSPRHHSQGITNIQVKKNSYQSPKRCYFKNTYCQSHPFLTTDHKITNVDTIKQDLKIEDRLELKRKMTEPQSSTVYKDFCTFTNGKNTINSPQKNRQIVLDLKLKIQKAKQLKKQKMKRIKYNYLVNNCYKSHLKSEISQPVTRTNHDNFEKTRENIFPTQKSVNQASL